MKPSAILCPIDFSDASRVAFDAACDLARDAGARLLVVHAYQLPTVGMPELTVVGAEMIQKAIDAARTALEGWTRDAAARGVARAESKLVEGVAWDRVCATARDEGCDLIVLSTHGRTGLTHALLGSVAERVVRHAPCSVLVVKPR